MSFYLFLGLTKMVCATPRFVFMRIFSGYLPSNYPPFLTMSFRVYDFLSNELPLKELCGAPTDVLLINAKSLCKLPCSKPFALVLFKELQYFSLRHSLAFESFYHGFKLVHALGNQAYQGDEVFVIKLNIKAYVAEAAF